MHASSPRGHSGRSNFARQFGFAALGVGITPLRLLPSRPSQKRYQYLLSDVMLPRVRQ